MSLHFERRSGWLEEMANPTLLPYKRGFVIGNSRCLVTFATPWFSVQIGQRVQATDSGLYRWSGIKIRWDWKMWSGYRKHRVFGRKEVGA